MHRSGRRFWATAIWMVRTKHFRQTTWWLQGRVIILALLIPQTKHSSSCPLAASWSWPSILQRRLSIFPVRRSSSSSRWCPLPPGASCGRRRYCWNFRRNPKPNKMLCLVSKYFYFYFEPIPGKLSLRKLFCLFFPLPLVISRALLLLESFCWCVIFLQSRNFGTRFLPTKFLFHLFFVWKKTLFRFFFKHHEKQFWTEKYWRGWM